MRRAAIGVALAAAVLFVAQACSSAASVGSGEWRTDDLLLWIDQTVINTMLVILAWMLLRRHFSMLFLPVALLAGEAVYDGGLLIEGLHGLLEKMPAYREILGRHSTMEVNPQYGMLVVYCALLAALVVSQFFRRWRTFDRMLAAVSATSIVCTFALFHVFLIGGIQNAVRQEERLLSVTLEGDFLSGCRRVGAACQIVHRDSPEVDDQGIPVDPVARKTVADIAAGGRALVDPFMWYGSTSKDVARTRFYVFAVATRGEDILLARGGASFEDTVRYERLRFTVQSVAAHVTWLIIFVVVSSVHAGRIRPAVRRFVGSGGFA